MEWGQTRLVRIYLFKYMEHVRLAPERMITQSSAVSFPFNLSFVHMRITMQISAKMQNMYDMIFNSVCLETTATPHPSSWILATCSCSFMVQDVAIQAVTDAVKVVSVHMHVAFERVHEDAEIAVSMHNNYNFMSSLSSPSFRVFTHSASWEFGC